MGEFNLNEPYFAQQRQAFLDHYVVHEGFLSEEEINLLIREASVIPYQNSVVGTDSKASANSSIRRSKIKWIPRSPLWQWLYDKIACIVTEDNYTYWQFNLAGWTENLQLSSYHENEAGHYEWHMDCGSGIGSRRKVSVTIQLSAPEEYEGGAMEFLITKDPVQVLRTKGTAVVFPSYMEHRVQPVTRGERRSLVVWVGGPAFV